MMEELITQSTIQPRVAGRHPIDGKTSVIVAGYVCVEATIVLLETVCCGIADRVLRDIGNVRQSAANTRGAGVDISKVLLAQANGQRRTDVQALSCNRIAIYAFDQSSICAGDRADHCSGNSGSLEMKVGVGNAITWRQVGKCRGRIPLCTGSRDGLALPLVGEESEDSVLPDRSAYTAAKLVVTIFIAEQTAFRRTELLSRGGIDCLHRLRSVPSLIRIQSGPRDLDKKAAVEIVGSALRGDFSHRARAA